MRIYFRTKNSKDWKRGYGQRQELVGQGTRTPGWNITVTGDQLPEALTWPYTGIFFKDDQVDVKDRDWQQKLVSIAAEAQSTYGDDHLEQFANDYWKTPEGRQWAVNNGLEYILEENTGK
jgi:hypothetical protein